MLNAMSAIKWDKWDSVKKKRKNFLKMQRSRI